jgi:hypothetical protein
MADTKPIAPETTPGTSPTPRPWLWLTIILGALVIGLWTFPRFWYTRADPSQAFVWLVPQQTLPGWEYKAVPVNQAAERLLAADETASGEFVNAQDQRRVQVFAAKRYTERRHDIGLFVHTPDRCWTEAGWQLEPAPPDHVELSVHGTKITFERRIFSQAGQRQLVLFGGLVGGQPLPYRLDHNLSVGMRSALRRAVKQSGGTLRASDKLFWQRVWESFLSRRQLLGPKEFLRVSTEVRGANAATADALLAEMLERWLRPAEFTEELRAWKAKE